MPKSATRKSVLYKCCVYSTRLGTTRDADTFYGLVHTTRPTKSPLPPVLGELARRPFGLDSSGRFLIIIREYHVHAESLCREANRAGNALLEERLETDSKPL